MMGTQLHLMAHGIDRIEVEPRTEIKSLSHETTFEEDTADGDAVNQALEALSEEVAKETISQALFFKTVTVKVRYENFETHTTSKTLPFMTNRVQDLKKTAKELLQNYLRSGRKVRLIGVRVSTFVKGEKQKTLM
jgi:nucleotidyltransferase/DNA polymerase involved in DNA repair